MSELRVVSVQIKDVLGAREFALQPGQVTVLSGRNGSGKSTALGALQAALGGGSLARLARVDPKGAETEPEVVLVIEGPGSEHYRVERTGDKVRVRARVGDTAALEDVGKPQGWLSALYDGAASNPVAFLQAADKDRALMLLEALPLKFDRTALLKEMGIGAEELHAMGAIPTGLHPLEEIAMIRQAVFSTRTGVNRDEKQQSASADQLRRNIPAVLPGDVSEQIQQGESASSNLAAEIAREEEAADAAFREATIAADAAHQLDDQKVTASFKADAAKLRREHDQKAAAIRAEAERQITEDLGTTEAAIQALREGGELVISEAEDRKAKATAAAGEAREKARAITDARKGDLATAREKLAMQRAQAEAGIKARALTEQVEQFDREAERLEVESERLTGAIEALDAHRRRLAEDLPIPGLSIEGKEIRVNGVLFEQLNTGQKVAIAVQVATLRAKGHRLPLVFVDGAEALDHAHFDALCTELKAQGVQALVGRVEDHELQVTVVEGEPVAAGPAAPPTNVVKMPPASKRRAVLAE